MFRLLLPALLLVVTASIRADDRLRIAVLQADATPPLGTPAAYALTRKIEDPLSARGIVLLGVGNAARRSS